MNAGTTSCATSAAEDRAANVRWNAPGLAQIRTAIGTHGEFFARQIEALAAQPALAGLATRDLDDPTIALLDAWSVVLDVLAFYQERFAQEGYLGTATERRSVLELARSIGRELAPGAAATTHLAFTLETAPGAPPAARIDAGTRVQSVAGQDELAQVFETLETIDARGEWNAVPLVRAAPAVPVSGARALLLRLAIGQRLQVGDRLLVVGAGRSTDPHSNDWALRSVAGLRSVTEAGDTTRGDTLVLLDRALDTTPQGTVDQVEVHVLRTRASVFGHNAPDWRALPAEMRGSLLGLPAGSKPELAEYPDWPGLQLSVLSNPPVSAPGTGTGLSAAYFANWSFQRPRWDQPAVVRLDAKVDLGAQAGAIALPTGVGPSNFAARWIGWIEFPTIGDYTFTITSDDGARLWLGDRLLIDDWTIAGHAPADMSSAVVRLQAGLRLPIRVDFYNSVANGTCILKWRGPGMAAADSVPSSRLYPAEVHDLHLDASYPRIGQDSWLVLEAGTSTALYRVSHTQETTRNAFTLSAKCTTLRLSGPDVMPSFDRRVRETTVWAEPERLAWGDSPMQVWFGGASIELPQARTQGLEAGRWIALSGAALPAAAAAPPTAGMPLAIDIEPSRTRGWLLKNDGTAEAVALEAASEVARIVRVSGAAGHNMRLDLDPPLKRLYLAPTAELNANVAVASHGDSRQMAAQPELLGSGDASRTHQRFVLAQGPLTALPDAGGRTRSALELRVDGALWREAGSFGELGPDDQAYVVQRDDDGRSYILFGDGVRGARLPSTMRVEARYRVGLGCAGNVAAGRLTQLMSRPAGVKAVTNPCAASGGADAETLEHARAHAAREALTLGRIVSLRDFEHFAAAFPGVGKAQAVWLWNGQQRVVHLTVSGIDGDDIDPASPLFGALCQAIDGARPAHQPLLLAPCVRRRFGLSAGVAADPALEASAVIARVQSALAEAFGFARRGFGQGVTGSELLAVMQGVAGVLRVDLDQLREVDEGGATISDAAGPNARLLARRARASSPSGPTTIVAAELLVIRVPSVSLTEMAP